MNIYMKKIITLDWLIGCFCFTSHRQRGHLYIAFSKDGEMTVYSLIKSELNHNIFKFPHMNKKTVPSSLKKNTFDLVMPVCPKDFQ